MTAEFLLTSLVVVLLPGTGVIYTLAIGLGRGWGASVLAAAGCTLGILPHIAASLAGLAALLHASAELFQFVKLLGVGYLLYMAWSMLRADGALQVTAHARPTRARRIVADGVLLNLLNPKLSLFFLAFLPVFVPAGTADPSLRMLMLAAVFMALTFVVFVGYGAFAAAARRYLVGQPGAMRWLRRGFAAAFGLLAVRLALGER